ncbi:PEP-CTERM -sorting domain protein [Methyloversatilis sp. RAC08]|uniref:DNRLRE domain-containing protein n=1 Tax=Methyloversatilis sp. RAC08 TaxID=1842540 RepID=UPI00083DBFC5|nr:DNRLRE domain-containing protein [Methyloversatilis sp. RAC08]AOF81571.1 PEP-CTERM -sorting domain protein [Methyloversatilis sp. RAC08]
MTLRKIFLTSALLAALPATASADTLVFQQGLNGYTGTQDTAISSNETGGGVDSRDTNFGAEEYISVDGDDGSPGAKPNHGLIRFDNLFGNAAGQIRTSDTIVSATLRIYVDNPGSGFTMYDMLTDWSQGVITWNSIGNGIQANGIEAAASPVFTIGANNGAENVGTDWLSIDLTASLQAAQSGAIPGYGWAMIPFVAGTNGIDFATSEYFAQNFRPELSVEVMAVPEPETYAMLLAGLGLIGFAARRRG